MLILPLLLALQVAPPADTTPSITLAGKGPGELQTRTQLERLLGSYNTRPWQFTSRVRIDAAAIPFSHPELTLSTRHLRDDELLLSTYLHEQLHWFIERHDSASAAAVRDLRVLFPKVPIGYPEGGADEVGNYYHLIVIYLEDRANQQLQGELRARQILEFWATDHYTWLYRTVRDRNREIGDILRKHGLLYSGRVATRQR